MEEQKQKILVVDDEPVICKMVGRILESENYPYGTAADADKALESLKQDDYGLMICDINMPGKSGIDLLRIVHEKYRDLAVVMATAVDDQGIAVQTLRMGAFGYVIKPFEINELIINIANALRRRELEIENRRHREELESLVVERTEELHASWEETILRLASVAEFRDNQTARHTVRMGEYCCFLARKAGLPEEKCQMIRVAAPLHDVGKVGLPDSILFKPGKLSEEEFEQVKGHSVIGNLILGESKSETLNLGALIALTHHEKYNGTGYPAGLKGRDIPLVGRIAAICDVFDALTFERVYKSALPVDIALAILKEERGEHFDPELLDLFVSNIDEIVAIKEQFADESDEDQ